MADQDGSSLQNLCIGCREAILPEALICPQCRSYQKPQRWSTLLAFIKWIGGATAVISLIIGVKQISGIVKDWKERDESVRQIVTASRLLMEARDYGAAWEIAKKAAVIAPSSQTAFRQQVDIALLWLRDIWVQKGEKSYGDIIDPLILTLSQGAGDDDPGRAARVLAHIAWANILRLRDKKVQYEVERYLVQALELNPEDTYANAFTGYWLLNEENKDKETKNKLSGAMGHFEKALKTNENSNFINQWYMLGLTGSNVANADVQAFKLASQWRKQPVVPLEPSDIPGVLGTLHWYFYSLDHRLPEKGFASRLVSTLSFEEIRDTYLWLLKEGKSDSRVSQDLRPIKNLGHLAEAAGKFEAAYAYYVDLLNRAKGSSSSYQDSVGESLCRVLAICREKGVALPGVQGPGTVENTIVLNGQEKLGIDFPRSVGMDIVTLDNGPAKQAGLRVGDIVLKIGDIPLGRNRYTALDQMKHDLLTGETPQADLFVLRGSKVLCYRVVN